MRATTAYGGIVAPPAMLEVWTMGGFTRPTAGASTATLWASTSWMRPGSPPWWPPIVSRNTCATCVPGDRVTQQVFFEEVSEEKHTALGSGHFLNYRYEFTDQRTAPWWDACAFGFSSSARRSRRAAAAAPSLPPPHPRPAITRDSAFFWDGLKQQRLLIRRCTRCQHLHHPPGPMCPKCHCV